MSQRAGTSQREALLKSYTRRLKDDVKSILDNYTEIIKTAKVCHIFLSYYIKAFYDFHLLQDLIYILFLVLYTFL